MSLYSLATDLFADMDKVRAAGTATDKERKNQQQRGTPEARQGRDKLEDATGRRDLLPRLSCGSSDAPPTLELLEGCLNDIQRSRLSVRRWRKPFELAPGSSPPSSEMTSFSADRQANCSPGDQHASRKRRSAVADAALGVPEIGDKSSSSSSAAIVQITTSRTNRAPDQLSVWKTPPASISRSSSSSSDSGEPIEELEATTAERRVLTGGANQSKTTTGVSKPYQSKKASARLLPRDTDAAINRAANTDTDADAVATASFVDFEHEVEDWSLSGGRGKASLRVRTNFAAYLSEKYLCDILDPMPSSSVVCRLRREIAHRIDSLANGAEEGSTAPGVVDGNEGTGEHQDIWGIGGDNVTTASQSEQNNVGCKTGQNGGGDTAPPVGGKHRAHFGSSKNNLAGRSVFRASSVRQGIPGSDHGNTGLTRRVKRPEEAKRTLFQDEMGSQPPDRNSSSSSSGSESIQGLDETGRELAKLDDKTSTAGRVPETEERFSAAFPPAPQQGDEKRRGSSDRSSRQHEREPRVRAVRFLLEEKAEETKSKGVPIGETVDVVSQTTQGERDGANATVCHEVKAETQTVEDGDCWTCVVCQTPNDNIFGAEGCTTCGRRRSRQWRQRCGGGAGARLATVPANNLATRNSRLEITTDHHEKERGGIIRNMEHPFAHNNARTNKGQSREENADACAIRKTATQSERRGPYDISSFARMRQATQPIVNARLGLSREIQSLLSSIRR